MAGMKANRFFFTVFRHAFMVSVTAVAPLFAASWTWVNPAGGGWNTATNWNLSSVPAGAPDTTLIFSQSTAYISTNDLASGLSLNQLAFTNGSGPVVLSGNPLNFTNNGATTPVLKNVSTNTIALANNVYTTSLTVNLAGDVTMNGTLFVSNGGVDWQTRLVKTGAGKLFLANAAAQVTAFSNNFFVDINQGSLQSRSLSGGGMLRVGQSAAAGNTSSYLLTESGDISSTGVFFGSVPNTTNIIGSINSSGTAWFNGWFYPSGSPNTNTIAYLSAAAGGTVSINNLIDNNSSSKDASNSVVKIGAGTVEIRSGSYSGGSWTNWNYRGNTTVRSGTLQLATHADGTARLGGALGYNNNTVQLGDGLTKPTDTVALLCRGYNLLVTHPLNVNAYGAGTSIGTADASSACRFAGNITLRTNLTVSAPNLTAVPSVTVSGNIADSVGANGVIVVGPGTVLFSGINTYKGPTLVNSGTLALSRAGGVTSVVSNSANIQIAGGAVLDVTGISAGFTVAGGQTLRGLGTVNGALKVGSGATLAPGISTSLGNLMVTSNLVLSGNAVFRLVNAATDQIFCRGTVSYGGTLTLSNLNGTFQAGDAFTLFPAAGGYSGAFSQIVPATPGAGLTWDLSRLNAGIIAVNSSGVAPPGINPGLANQTIMVGKSAPITAYARGSGSLSYQWSTNGTAIFGATGRSFLPNFLQPGAYTLSVLVTNNYGSTTSSATLTVQDGTAPVVTLLGANPMTVLLNSTFVDPGATNYDRGTGARTLTTISTVNTSVAGVYTVTYSATDLNSNTGTAVRVVKVVPTTGIYVQAPMYPGVFSQKLADNLRNSGFNTVMLFSFSVGNNYITCGQVNSLIISNGVYVGDPAWPAYLATLKLAPTSISRVEVCFGGWGNGTFGTISNLMATYGTNVNTVLYSNLMVLKAVTGADAINNDDELVYDAPSAAQFSLMCASMGYKTTLCPYTRSTYWSSIITTVNSARPGTVDSIQLQCYAGGAGNNPATWNANMGMKVSPGLETAYSTTGNPGCASGNDPSVCCTKFGAWRSSPGISGGWLWLYDYLPNEGGGWGGYCPTYTLVDYVSGINCYNCTGNAGPIAGSTTVITGSSNIAYSIAAIGGVASYTWTVPAGASIVSGQGTTAIVVGYGDEAVSGSVGVWPANASGCGGLGSMLGVTVTPVGNAGPIFGPTTVSAGQTNRTYSIGNVNGAASYMWTVPPGASIVSGQGSTTVMVNYGAGAASGYVSVTPANTSGAIGAPANVGVTVTSADTAPVMNFGAVGATLNLSWPAGRLGWRLLVQTNLLDSGLSTNWFTWPNSTNWTSVGIPIMPANPSVFFKLVYP